MMDISEGKPGKGKDSTSFPTHVMSTALASLLFPLLAWLLFKALRIGRRERFLPPGPPTVPILGNMHVFPTESPHLKFTEWAHEYGEIYSLKIGSSTIIVISSMEAAKELMDKRSSITSDRPKNHMVDKITNGLSLFEVIDMDGAP
ncbi:cytochrome p450 [Moniliophthora roreri]|nr:cytochrome p450 [Moniliophthora roreri]